MLIGSVRLGFQNLIRGIKRPDILVQPSRLQGRDQFVMATSLLAFANCTTTELVVGFGALGLFLASSAAFLLAKPSEKASLLMKNHDPNRPSPGSPPEDL